MSLTTSSIRCSLQVALLGAVTPNLRAINVEFDSQLIKIIFYYDKPPTEEEKDIAEVVATEVISDFIDIQITVQKIHLPYPNKIPEIGLRIFHRHEI